MPDNIDTTLLNAAKLSGDHADLYGDHVKFWDKAATLASIKLGRPLSGHDMIMAKIAMLEARIANKWDEAENYAHITSLHAIASLYIKPKSAIETMLTNVEQDIKDMASKLVNGDEHAQG